ncbi:MAG: hypothetical protein LBP63_10875 [Prevotellaceae bacterium]|jgi:hypothetical protein|nr:hypothetical protein [Prevotellaceae bacterium]
MIPNKIFAQTEMQRLSLPDDTVKYILNIKSTTSNDSSYQIRQNPYPVILTIEDENLYLSAKDLQKLDSLDLSDLQKNNFDILFVRSAYFSPDSKLFASQKQSFSSFTGAEYFSLA